MLNTWKPGSDDFLVSVGDQYKTTETIKMAELFRLARDATLVMWQWWSHTHSRAGATPRPPHFRLGQRSLASGRVQTSDALHYLSLIVISSLLWLTNWAQSALRSQLDQFTFTVTNETFSNNVGHRLSYLLCKDSCQDSRYCQRYRVNKINKYSTLTYFSWFFLLQIQSYVVLRVSI